LGGAAAIAAALLVLPLARGGGDTGAAVGATAAQLPTAGDSFEPQLGLPAGGVTVFGSSPGEAAGETWAYGALGQTPVYVEGKAYSNQDALLVRSDASRTWQVMPLPEGPEGKPLSQLGSPAQYGALAGQATQAGGVVLLVGPQIVVRDPGGQPQLAPVPPEAHAESLLAPGESLLPPSGSGTTTVPYAAVEEAGQRTGVLIAPYHDGGKQSSSGEPESQPGMLHYDGTGWLRETVEAQGEQLTHFTALAMSCSGTQSAPSASSPENCWLLASYGLHEPEHLVLYRRVRSGKAAGWSWRPQPVADWMLGQQPPPAGVSAVGISPLAQGAQMLTATAQGVWVDFEAHVTDSESHTTAASVSELVLTPGEGSEEAKVAGSWCYPTLASCKQSLGAPLPTVYRSFAWPGADAGQLGTRVITGLSDGMMLELSGGSFLYMPSDGAAPGNGGAALYRSSPQSPVEGVIDGASGGGDADRQGQSPVIGVTSHPEGDQLHEEAVPFQHPLLAVTQVPDTSPGDPNAEALAVGVEGEVGRFVPGEGWQPEALYEDYGSSSRRAATPNLRGVAWPEPKRAYAVGDEGNMWLWMKETGYWVPDPAKPFNFKGNLTAIAFDENNPQLGFAVGKQGVLLKYGKSWEEISKQIVKREAKRLEQELGTEEWRLNFTSVAFAGGEAMAAYRVVVEESYEAGGLLVYNEEPVCGREDEQLEHEGKRLLGDERECWHVDSSAAALLAQQPSRTDTVLSKVAGLPDGGAAAAGPDVVMERESPGAPWHLAQTPLPEAQNISALAAYREPGGSVRAIASIELNSAINPNHAGLLKSGLSPYGGDVPVITPGQPPPYIPADPLPDTGDVVKETAGGWADIEHEALPVRPGQVDMPIRPDPVFALTVNSNGSGGLAVGGQTYNGGGYGPEVKGETAGALRFPAASAQGEATTVPIAAPAGQVSFVIGGEASCEQGCAALANESIGPDVWLTHALQTAARIEGARAFLYLGARASEGVGVGAAEAYEREVARFQELLGAAGTLPVDVEPTTFKEAIATEDVAEPCTQAAVPCEAGISAYSVKSTGSSGGPARILMLDYSAGSLGPGQLQWLEHELQVASQAEEPAIVAGRDSLGFNLNGAGVTLAPEAEKLTRILVEGHASAYIFDYTSVNVHAQVSYRGESVPVYGTGTLGPNEAATGGIEKDGLHSSATLLLSVNTAAGPNPKTGRWEVSARAVPNVGQLSIKATDGMQVPRSRAAVFGGLARRPPAGISIGGSTGNENRLIYPSVYDPIPTECQGPNCSFEVPLEYTFTSSKPDIGSFIVHEASSSEPDQVQLNSKRKPIPDEPRNSRGELNPGLRFDQNATGEPINEHGETLPAEHSALFCAYNEGTTVITITAGGLSYSMPVTVQGGSVEYPCGTVPLVNPPPLIEPSTTPLELPQPSFGHTPFNPQIQSLVPPPVPVKAPISKHAPTAHIPVPPTPATLFPLPVLVPPPAPSLAQPTPPSGTAQVPAQSPVSQTVAAAEREEEVEGAYQHVHNMALYDRHRENESTPVWPLALILIAAAAGAGMRPRRDREGPAYAWARSSGANNQRRR
jgi:hypothetical protein